MPFRHRLMIRMRPVLRFVRHRILHVDDSPQRTARGIAVGLFVSFLPLFGLQMLLAFFLAKVSRANKVLAMLSVWVSNPLTAIFIYYPCYRIGRFLLAQRSTPQLDSEELEQAIESTFSFGNILNDIFTADFWHQVGNLSAQIGLETLIGGLFLGIISAKAGYWLSLIIIQRYRRRKHHFFKRLALKRQKAG